MKTLVIAKYLKKKIKERHCYFPTETDIERDFYAYPQAVSLSLKVAMDCVVEDFSFPFIFPKFNEGNEKKNQKSYGQGRLTEYLFATQKQVVNY